jgi:hypothetical protein
MDERDDEIKKYMLAVSQDPSEMAMTMTENVNFGGKLALFGIVIGVIYGFATKRSIFVSGAVGGFIGGGTAYLIRSLKK